MKSHIILDQKNYFLVPESYQRNSQVPLYPRFSSGDPSLSDLSFWQYIAQEDWSGGAGQRDNKISNKFWKSSGIIPEKEQFQKGYGGYPAWSPPADVSCIHNGSEVLATDARLSALGLTGITAMVSWQGILWVAEGSILYKINHLAPIKDEAFTTDLDDWVSLAHKNIQTAIVRKTSAQSGPLDVSDEEILVSLDTWIDLAHGNIKEAILRRYLHQNGPYQVNDESLVVTLDSWITLAHSNILSLLLRKDSAQTGPYQVSDEALIVDIGVWTDLAHRNISTVLVRKNLSQIRKETVLDESFVVTLDDWIDLDYENLKTLQVRRDETKLGPQTIVNESFAADLDAWVSLAHKNVSRVIVNAIGGTSTGISEKGVLIAGRDYKMDSAMGQIMMLSGGNMQPGKDYLLSYKYKFPLSATQSASKTTQNSGSITYGNTTVEYSGMYWIQLTNIPVGNIAIHCQMDSSGDDMLLREGYHYTVDRETGRILIAKDTDEYSKMGTLEIDYFYIREAEIKDEEITFADTEEWLNLQKQSIIKNSDVCRWDSTVAGMPKEVLTYKDGYDYILDKKRGKIKCLSLGRMIDTSNYRIDYEYDDLYYQENIDYIVDREGGRIKPLASGLMETEVTNYIDYDYEDLYYRENIDYLLDRKLGRINPLSSGLMEDAVTNYLNYTYEDLYYKENIDYILDRKLGKIKPLNSGGMISGATNYANYQYGDTYYKVSSDYVLNLREGKIKILSSGDIESGETIYINYSCDDLYYEENKDYLLDRELGRIKALSLGLMEDAITNYIDYDYIDPEVFTGVVKIDTVPEGDIEKIVSYNMLYLIVNSTNTGFIYESDGKALMKTVEHTGLDIKDLVLWKGIMCYSGGRTVLSEARGYLYQYPGKLLVEMKDGTGDQTIRHLYPGEQLYYYLTNLKVYAWNELGYYMVSGTDGYLYSSELAGNTPLIDKLFNQVTIEFKDSNHDITLEVQKIEDGDSETLRLDKVDDNTYKVDLPSQYISAKIILKFTLNDTDTIIRRVITRYVPAALLKKTWAFTIKAENHLRFGDGTYEQRTGEEIENALWDLRDENKIIKFKDIDESEYDVIIQDLSHLSLGINSENKQEGEVTVGLLEV